MNKVQKWTGILLIGLATIAYIGCEKDEDSNPNEVVNSQLQGEWEVTSYTKDGEEWMDYTISSFDMNFKSEAATMGELEWDVKYTDGTSEIIEFDYTIKDNGLTIELDEDEFDLEITGVKLEIAGSFDGYRYVIKASKD